jgi:hypothetical protein
VICFGSEANDKGNPGIDDWGREGAWGSQACTLEPSKNRASWAQGSRRSGFGPSLSLLCPFTVLERKVNKGTNKPSRTLSGGDSLPNSSPLPTVASPCLPTPSTSQCAKSFVENFYTRTNNFLRYFHNAARSMFQKALRVLSMPPPLVAAFLGSGALCGPRSPFCCRSGFPDI